MDCVILRKIMGFQYYLNVSYAMQVGKEMNVVCNVVGVGGGEAEVHMKACGCIC
jgi:hypothetical protein